MKHNRMYTLLTVLLAGVIGLVLYWSLISMKSIPDPNWIEEPSNELMDFK